MTYIAKEEINKIYNRLTSSRLTEFSREDCSKMFSYIHSLEDEIRMRLDLENEVCMLKRQIKNLTKQGELK